MSIIREETVGTVISVVIKSSNIKSAVYNTETKRLTVTFNNSAIYEYYDVPWEVFTRLRLADSQGKYFSKEINGKYKYRKV